MKVLVTGATGLLGSDVVYTLELKGKKTVKTCFSERGGDYISADITSTTGLKILDRLDWDYVVHTSAWRKPDQCENDKENAYSLNVSASERIAEMARSRGAGMLFISSDYVFSGENPPYSENDKPNPVNYYGETKALAENKIMMISSEFIILRIPLLYGIRAGLAASDVLSTALEAINSSETRKMDNTIIRYPTYTGDVSEVINFLINKGAGGIYHFSGQDKSTKYSIAKSIGEVLGRSMDNILKVDSPPDDDANRPADSHLNMEKLLGLGFGKPLSFKLRVEKIMNALGMLRACK